MASVRPKGKPPFKRNQRGHGLIAEFGAVFAVVVMFVITPLVATLIIGSGAALTYAISIVALNKVANATTFANALSAMETAEETMDDANWLSLARFKPCGGYKNGGFDLHIVAIDQRTKEVSLSPANSPLQQPIDTGNKTYEYMLRTSLDVGPYWDGYGSGLARDLPFVGKPTRISFTARRLVEHPEGL